jgi:hypothetical protein
MRKSRSSRPHGAVALLAFVLGCGRCSDEPRVPFKLGKQGDSAQADPIAGAAQDAGSAEAKSFAIAADRPSLAGGPLPLTLVRALLEVDLDADGDRDVVALHQDAAQTPLLSVVTREASGYGPARAIAGFTQPVAPGCALSEARLAALSSSKAALTVALTCDATSPALTARSSVSLLSLEATPRIHERLDVLAGAPGAELPFTSMPSSVDADRDGHDDVVFRVLVAGASDPLDLVWLDRPSGLVRDVREPEATLAAWAAAAQSLLSKSPEQAIARAELALSVQRALCRELGTPTIALSGTPGIPCGAGKSTAALLATLSSAHARRGAVRAAFESYARLRRVEPKPDARTLEQVGAALRKLPAVANISFRRGPAVEPVRAPRVHLPSARFVGESQLYVQRTRPVLYDLERAEESPAPSASDQLMRDPRGQLIATAIERSCLGYEVRIERAPPRGSDYVAGPLVAQALLSPSAPGPWCGSSGAKLPPRHEDGGFSVLGWPPQGLLAARGSELVLVPLSASGEAVGPPRALAPDAPRPAPLPSGSATADGARYVEATAHGVLIYGPSSDKVELWRPGGYTDVASGALEAAISPSASRVAIVAGQDVYLLERAPVR